MTLDEIHEMRQPVVEKVVVHMNVGEGGRELQNAEEIIEDITGQTSVRTHRRNRATLSSPYVRATPSDVWLPSVARKPRNSFRKHLR